jgi:hypothetical protein
LGLIIALTLNKIPPPYGPFQPVPADRFSPSGFHRGFLCAIFFLDLQREESWDVLVYGNNQVQEPAGDKNGIMEEWNIAMMGQEMRTPKPIIPSFHHSIVLICLLCGKLFCW